MTYMLHSIRSPQPLECRNLEEAMARAGHPDPADWLPYLGMPGWAGRIVTDSTADESAIEAIDVAHELIRLLPVGACATRVWSDADPEIACAVWAALPSPFPASAAVAARLSAHYAVAGFLSWTTIADTAAAAFEDAPAAPSSDMKPIITEIIAALAAEGILTVPPPTSAKPVLLAAPWRPGMAWLPSGGAPPACVEVPLLDLKTASRVVRGHRASSSPVTEWPDVALHRFLTALDKATAPLTAFDTWAHRIMSPVWTITIPGGKLPATWCTWFSRWLSRLLPMAICCAGIFGAWHAARSTALWGGAWQGAWPGITLWGITWWLVSLIPEKLLGFWIRPHSLLDRDRSGPPATLLVVPDEIALIAQQAPCRQSTIATPHGKSVAVHALLRLALQGRRAELSAPPSATPPNRQFPPADGQQ
jgi:hypothetical protein